MESASVAAVDLGASSGRVMLAHVGADRLELTEVNRFANEPVRLLDTLHWDVLALHRGILDGLAAAAQEADVLDGVGIDTWGVDYGLLDSSGALLGNPVHYRDNRTDGVMDQVLAKLDPADIYGVTGLQFLPFNTIYQLVAAAGTPQLEAARRLLLIPDLLGYWLTGAEVAEVTNASTTQLLDVRSRRWSTSLMNDVGVNAGLFPPLVEPGACVGQLLPAVLEETGLSGPVPLTAVGSHDTASAIVGVPATSERFAYVSCGTWSLVGVELDAPVLTQDSRQANFTNELGVDGTVRYLQNVMGLWLLQESLRAWNATGQRHDLVTLLREAARVPTFTAVVDPDDPAFLPPGDMPTRIADACRRTGQTPPQSPAETVRCILDSLALAYRRVVRQAQKLSGREVDVVHVVGGGSRNALLCQLTADACGLPVVAGPVEATALGNVLIQARSLDAVHGDLSSLRDLLARSQQLTRYEPKGDSGAWDAAERRIIGVKMRADQ
jgi:rhamnulokinase